VAGLSDKTLMAYADGVLDPAERAAVEAALREHPEYQLKVAKFRATLEPVQRAIDGDLDKARLAALAAKIRRAEERSSTADDPGARIVKLPGRRAPTAASAPRTYAPLALAASLALMIGGGLGWLARGAPEPAPLAAPGLVAFDDGSLVAAGPLAKLLETTSSGTALRASLSNGAAWQLKASFSFRSVDGVPCRRYEMGRDASARFAGYACRSADGRWSVRAQARLPATLENRSGGGDFTPAGGDEDALDAAVRAAMDGDMLPTTEEARLIAGAWATRR
jgi:hypothetical protein